LHSEVDRPDAEGTLRTALWPPLTVLTIYFGASGSRGWFFALLVPLLIAAQARSRSKQANDALLVAITVDPAIEKSVRDDLGMDKTLLGIDDKARRFSSRD
jgi:hypothetical protein